MYEINEKRAAYLSCTRFISYDYIDVRQDGLLEIGKLLLYVHFFYTSRMEERKKKYKKINCWQDCMRRKERCLQKSETKTVSVFYVRIYTHTIAAKDIFVLISSSMRFLNKKDLCCDFRW